MTALTTSGLNSRISSIDSLRGFALAGIVIVHMVEQFLGGMVPENTEVHLVEGIADNIVDIFIFLFFRGKFFALFAFLFGVSFFIQMDRAAKKGKDFRARFIWRIAILLIFGFVHNLFYRGDILMVYSALGLLLPLFYNVRSNWLFVTSILLFAGVGRYFIFVMFGSDPILSGFEFSPSSPKVLAYWNILKQCAILDVFMDNITNGLTLKFDFQFGVVGRGYLTFGFFLIGLWAGRIDLFNRFDEFRKIIKKTLWWFLALAIVFLAVMAGLFMQIPQPVQFNTWFSMFALTAYDIHNIAMTIFLICGFMLIFHKKKKSFLLVFSKYGQTALTNYVVQSVFGTFIFYNWGLGYLGEIRNIYTFFMGIGIVFLQILVSKWWMARFKYGPLEWIWRCATYFKKMPFLKPQVNPAASSY